MTAHDPRIGGQPVGQLNHLDDASVCAVIYLRLWSQGPEGRAAVWNELAAGLGVARARTATAAFETLTGLLRDHGRRPLTRHTTSCTCLGADEACFAHFVTTAATGDREDAMMMAMLMVRHDFAPMITASATDFGLSLRQLVLRSRRIHPCERTADTLLH